VRSDSVSGLAYEPDTRRPARNTDDLLALQDEITSRIAVALDLELVGAEAARPIAARR
jgi:hypothetical protein